MSKKSKRIAEAMATPIKYDPVKDSTLTVKERITIMGDRHAKADVISQNKLNAAKNIGRNK